MNNKIYLNGVTVVSYTAEIVLDNCPCCGSEPQLAFRKSRKKLLSGVYVGKIHCPKCGIQTKKITGPDRQQIVRELADVWNKRPAIFDLDEYAPNAEEVKPCQYSTDAVPWFMPGSTELPW